MASSRIYPYPTGKTLYAFFLGGGQVWNNTGTPAYESPVSGHYTQYAVALTEAASTGLYTLPFPATLPSGDTEITVYLQAGGSPAASDTIAATDQCFCSGSGVIAVPNSDKAGYSLAATGLDAITTTEPTIGANGAMSTWNFRLLLRWAVARFANASKTPSSLAVKTLAGATMTSQSVSDDLAGTESTGVPS